jgi:ATP-binding cassette subfamily B protein
MRPIQNNIYILRMVWRASPLRIILCFLDSILNFGGWMFYSLYFMKFIVDSIEYGRSFQSVVVFLFLFLLYQMAVSVYHSWYTDVFQMKEDMVVQEYIISQVYKQAVRVDLSCYENPEFYNKYTRANEEVITRATQILNNVSNLVAIILSAIASAAVIGVYEPLIFPIVLIPAVVVLFLDKKNSVRRFERYNETTKGRRQVDYVDRVVYLQDFAKELRLGKIFGPIYKHFEEAIEQMIDITKRYSKKIAALRFLRELVMGFVIFLAVQGLIIYRYLKHNAYQLGTLVTILNAAANLSDLVRDISYLTMDFYQNGLYVENIRTFLEYQPNMVDAPNAISTKGNTGWLHMEQVSFSYEGQINRVLKDITLDIAPHSKVAFVGHNGAGKSTLVKLLMRLYDVTDGQIQLDGKDIREYKIDEYRGCYGTVFQDFQIFAASVYENVLLYPPRNEEDKRRAEEAVRASGLMEKIQSLPHGMDTILTKEFDEDGAILSGGEFQKLAVARVFAKESTIAILDEPSSALDPISEYELFENMMQACKNKTVIFISHRLSSAIMADSIYLLEHGEIVEEGSHCELMEKGGRYAQMFLMQAEKYREEQVE